MPIGIIASLLICTVLYIAVSAVLTGMVPYDKIDIDAPVSDAFTAGRAALGAVPHLARGARRHHLGAAGHDAVSQPRVLLAMARDGLLPPELLRRRPPEVPHPLEVHDPDRRSSSRSWARLLPLRILAELANIGTLLAFVIVCIAVLIMRVHQPRGRAAVPGAVRHRWCRSSASRLCLLLMFSLPGENWLRLFVWLLIGFVIYFGYGRHHSVMAKDRAKTDAA